MKPNLQAGRGNARGVVVAGRGAKVPSLLLGSMVLSAFLLPAFSPLAWGERDPLSEARAVLAQRRDEAEQRRGAEEPGAWSRLTTRPASPFQRTAAGGGGEAKAPHGPSPFNPKFGAPAFQMPSTPAQDASAPQLKQFHPTEEPGVEPKGRRFLTRENPEREDCPEDAERRAAEKEQGRKSTLSYTGEEAEKERLRTYDEIYQSKSPYALPTFQMPSGPAASLAAPGAQTWGGRVLTQYRPEVEAKGLERARMQREMRADERETRREEGTLGLREMFDRTKRLESR